MDFEKLDMRGGMKSLWIYLREKRLTTGVRSSLENFASLKYVDPEADGTTRDILICPLYALSELPRLLEGK